jgi:hypothetical protein
VGGKVEIEVIACARGVTLDVGEKGEGPSAGACMNQCVGVHQKWAEGSIELSAACCCRVLGQGITVSQTTQKACITSRSYKVYVKFEINEVTDCPGKECSYLGNSPHPVTHIDERI